MEIRIGVSEQMAPYQFWTIRGSLPVSTYDLLKSLEIGSDDSVSVLYFDSEDACLEALEDGEVDAVLSYRLPAELSYAQWATEPLTTLKLCAISKTARWKMRKKEGQVAAFEYGTVNYSYLQHLDATSYLAVGSQRQILCRRSKMAARTLPSDLKTRFYISSSSPARVMSLRCCAPISARSATALSSIRETGLCCAGSTIRRSTCVPAERMTGL